MKKINLFFIFAILILLAVPMGMADPAVVIQPDPANDLDTLHCVVQAGGSGYTYEWKRNGQSTSISGAYVSPSYTSAGDTWTCKVKKYYGSSIGWINIGQDSIYVYSSANQVPVVNITNPDNGESFIENTSINFAGTANDPEDGTIWDPNAYQWFSDIDGGFGTGNNISYDMLSVGTHVITLEVTDSQGGTGSDSITIVIDPQSVNQPPLVQITAPNDGDSFFNGTSILFTGSAVDPEDGVLTGTDLQWYSDVDGNFGLGTSVSYDSLSIGTHTITLVATDSNGVSANDSITITINATPANNPPVVNITLPVNGTSFSCGQLVNFEGSAYDPDNDPLTLRWFSSIDNLLGYGNTTQDILTCNATHQIDFVADDGQANATDTIYIVIGANLTTNNPPNATIISPVNGSQYVECQEILFNGTAQDVEGISSIAWIYDSASISNNLTFSRSGYYFGEGNHSITFRVTDTDGNINETTVSFEVVRHQAPTVTIGQPANGTQWNVGTLLNFSATAVNNDAVCPTNYTWIWEDNFNQIWNQSRSFSTSNLSIGNHTITAYAIDAYNRSGSDQIQIEILEIPNDLPVAQIISPNNNDSFINECQDIFFNASAYDPDGNVTEYQWVWNSNVIGSSSNFTMPASYFGNGNHTVRLIVRDNRNGQNSTTVNFTVVPHLAPSITITSPANNSNFSEGTMVNFSAVAVANDACPVNFSYTWMENAEVLANSENFSTGNLSVGTHQIVARVDDSYSLYDTDSVIVNILEIPNILPNITDITCYNETGGTALREFEPITCIAQANDPDGNITSWVWSVQNFYGPFFLNNTFNVPSPYLENGTYNVSLTVQDNDLNQSTRMEQITVQNNAPVVTLVSNVTDGTEPMEVSFTCSVQNGTGNRPYSYSFNFGNGVTDTYSGNETTLNYTIDYMQNGTYTAVCTVTDRDGDVGSANLTINVNDTVPVGNFNWTPQAPYECTNVQFTSNVSAYDGILSYFWDFMDGSNSTLENPVHNFTQNGTYNVELNVTDRDFSSSVFTNTVFVNDTVPIVEAGPDRYVVEGNNLTFIGSAIPRCDAVVDYEWYFEDDGSTMNGQVVSHNFTQNGTYTVVFTAIDSDGSRASDNLTVVVNDTAPNAQGFAIPNPVVEGNQAVLNASLSAGYDQPLNYEWNINGTIVTGEITNYTFGPYLTNNPVLVEVNLTVTDADGSADNDSIIVVVLDSVPNASFTATPNPVVEGQQATFDAGASTAFDGISNYTWDFGDGTNVTVTANPVINHNFSQNGTYLVRLTVTDLDGSTDEETLAMVVTDTVPVAGFTWDPNLPLEGEQVNFTDQSTAYDTPLSYIWDFGDNTSVSNQQNATHTYLYNGTYNVALTVIDSDGSVNSTTRQITIGNSVPSVSFTANPSSGDELLNVSFNCSAVSGNLPYTFNLVFNGGLNPNITTKTDTGVLATNSYLNGTYTATCTVTDFDGDSASSSVTILVNDLGPTAILTGNLTLYEGETGTYDASNSTSSPDSIVQYEWDWNYPSSFAIGNAVESHTFEDSGSYDVAVRVTDSDGTQDTAVITVNAINLPPTVNFLQPLYETNESTEITMQANATDPSIVDQASLIYEWDFDYRGGTFTVDNTTATPYITMNWTDDRNVTIAVRAVDKDGGVSDPDYAELLVHNVPPTPLLAGPYICSNQTVSNASNVTLFVMLEDPGNDTFVHLWNITDDTAVQINTADRNSSVTFVCTGRPTGIYNVTFEAWDDDWGYSGVYTTYINVTDSLANMPPTIVAPSENQTINAQVNTTSNFTVLAWDPNGDNLTFNFNDSTIIKGSQNQSMGFVTLPISYNYTQIGVYEINLTVCDDSGYANNCTSRLFSINVTEQAVVNQEPVADANGPYSGDEGSPVAFDGSGSYDPDGSIVAYSWDFGDGNTAAVQNPNHTYGENGSYTVTLTVVDDSGATNTTTTSALVDNVAPTADAGGPYTCAVGENLTLYGSGSDPAGINDPLGYAWDLDNDGAYDDSASQNATYTCTATGIYTVSLNVSDDDGGSSTDSATVNVTALPDTSPPVVMLESPADGSEWNISNDVLFEYNVTDSESAIAHCELIINGTSTITDNSVSEGVTQNFTLTLSDGAYTWSVNCTDASSNQNEGASSSRLLVINTTSPSAGNGTIINSTIYGGFYANNASSDVSETLVSNTTWMHNSTVQGNPVVNITGNNNLTYAILTNVTAIHNCTAIGNSTSPTELTNTQCVNQVVDPSTISDSDITGTKTITNSIILDSNATYNEIITNSEIYSSTVNNSEVYYSLINRSQVYDSIINYSTILDSIVRNSTIQNSTIDNSTVIDSNVSYSTISDSDITGSEVTNSTIDNSNVTNSTVDNSNITNSTVDNSTIEDSNIINSTIIDSNITNSTIINGTIINETISNSVINGTEVCGGTVNGIELNGSCIYFPVIENFSVPSSANTGENVNLNVEISNQNSSNNESASPYTYEWSFGDGNANEVKKNETTDSKTHSYSSSGTYTVSIVVSNKYNLSAADSGTITISDQSNGGGSDGGGGGSSSTGGSPSGQSGLLTLTGEKKCFDLEDGEPEDIYIDINKLICFEFEGEEYTIEFTQVTNGSADMLIHPPRIPVTLLERGTTIEDLNEDFTDDLSMRLNEVVREVDEQGFVSWKADITLRLVNLGEEEEEESVVEDVKGTLSDVKRGVLDVAGKINPAEGASPYIGTGIAAGIVAVGLAGYVVFRKRKPKL